jgi:hypothetical protein
MITKSQTRKDSADLPTAELLRKRQADGRLYARPPEVEAQIAELSRLTKEQFVERIEAEGSDESVRSECLLYFVRRPPFGSDKDVLFLLFAAIRQRVLKAIPVPTRSIPGKAKMAERLIDLEIRDAVLGKFELLLCQDRVEYQERLDFYECRFNAGMARLRSTARRDIRNEAEKFVHLAPDNETGEPCPEVEEALSCISDLFDGPKTDFLYRSKIHAAISSLPLEERRVVELFLRDIPIDSQEADTMTMVTMLGCSEKTVHNRKKRAFAKLEELLKEDNA